MAIDDQGLSARDLAVAVPGRRLVSSLGLDLKAGEFVALLGQNGAGKTLTLMTLAGLREPEAGRVSFAGRPIGDWNRRRLAQRLGMLPQDSDDVFPTTVFETALVGRHPHLGLLELDTDKDHNAAIAALRAVGLESLRGRDVATLSGGERRRLAIAQTLTQAPEVFLLDEPLNHLDPQHQLEILELFHGLTRSGSSVLASLHDPNLARRYADRALVLFGNGRWLFDDVDRVLTAETLSEVYSVRVESVPWRDGQLFVATK